MLWRIEAALSLHQTPLSNSSLPILQDERQANTVPVKNPLGQHLCNVFSELAFSETGPPISADMGHSLLKLNDMMLSALPGHGQCFCLD